MKLMKIKLACALALGVVGMAQTAVAAPPLKAAFVYFGTPGDGGWTFAHDIAVKQAKKELGAAVETTIVENVLRAPMPSA